MGLFNWFGKSNTAYFPGSMTFYKFGNLFELYQDIFRKLKIDFKILNGHAECGLEVFEAGYESEARKLARFNFEIFKDNKILSIITNSPECYYMFLKIYPEILPYWDIEVIDLWGLILRKLHDKPGLIKNKAVEVVGFHDNCYLGRYCKIYDSPRRILEAIGYEIEEFDDNKEQSLCCGSCGGVSRTNPGLANNIARERILQAKRRGIKKLVVCSTDNYRILKKNAGKDIEVFELSEILGHALGLNELKNEEIEGEEEIFSNKESAERKSEEKVLSEVESNIKLGEGLKEEDDYYKGKEL